MAFVFYSSINLAATHMVMNHPLDKVDAHILVSQIMVYEVLLFWSNDWICMCLALLFVTIAILNVIFTSFIAYE